MSLIASASHTHKHANARTRTHCSDCYEAAQAEGQFAPRSSQFSPLAKDAVDVENSGSEEEEKPRFSALQEHNAIHGRGQREIDMPTNDFGASRFKMKAPLSP